MGSFQYVCVCVRVGVCVCVCVRLRERERIETEEKEAWRKKSTSFSLPRIDDNKNFLSFQSEFLNQDAAAAAVVVVAVVVAAAVAAVVAIGPAAAFKDSLKSPYISSSASF